MLVISLTICICLPPTFGRGVSGSPDNGSSNSVLAVSIQDLNNTLNNSYDPDAVALALIPYLKDDDQQVRLLAISDIIITKSKRPEVSQAETDLLNDEPAGPLRDLLELGLQTSRGTIPTGNHTSSTPPRIGTIEDLSGIVTVPKVNNTSPATEPYTRQINGYVKYLGGNAVRSGVDVKLQEIFDGNIFDIASSVSSRQDGSFKIMYSSDGLHNPDKPHLILQAFSGGKPFSAPVDIGGTNDKVELICSPHQSG
jgi:hypothetical protein